MSEDSARFSPAEKARPRVRGLHPYVPGFQPPAGGHWVKLNTNENPYPPSPAVEAAITAELARLPLYPNPSSAALRAAIAAHHELSPAQVFAGNGSDEILALLVRVFGGDSLAAAWTVPSYSLYPVLAAMEGVELRELPFTREMTLDVEAAAATGANLFFLTNPNAPTGVAFPPAEVARLAEALDGILVVDEAYADFAEENCTGLVARHPNVVVTRTFSKSYGLAGLRVGYCLAHEETIGLLDRVRDSYNLDRLAQAGAAAALADTGYLHAIVGKLCRIRDYHAALFRSWGWFTYPSQANFLFTEPTGPDGQPGPDVAASLFAFLKEQKILVRAFPRHPLTASFLRISIGDEEQMHTLTDALDAWRAGEE